MKWNIIFFFLLLLAQSSCHREDPGPKMGFVELDMSVSNIDFSNSIIENDTLNYFNFPFLYLGGGVSLGDVNNDDLVDIYFTGNMVPNKLYLNKGNLKFEDITESAGVSGDNRWYTGTTMADVNNDGYLDIYVSASEIFGNGTNQLYINNGDETFSEKAESYGIADGSTSIQSTFFDYDNDGFLDLFVGNYPLVKVSMGNAYYYDFMQWNRHRDSGHLFKNNGNGSFSDVTKIAGVQNFGLTLGLVASDFNNDGHKDLYLSNDFNVPDYLYINNGNGTFSEVSQKASRHTAMFGMGIDAADFNNDGLTDLFQLDMTAEDYKRSKTNMASMTPETFYEAIDLGFNYQYMQNALQLNSGVSGDSTPIFSDISRFAGVATTDWSWGVLFVDFDNDGLKDAFVSNGIKRDVNNNDINARYESASVFGNRKARDFRMMPSTPIANFAFKNNGDFTFSETTQTWGLEKKGFSNGFAYADLDNDGDMDLVINNIDANASIYINRAETEKNHYVKLRLLGKKENPFGIGAKVVVKTGSSAQTQELTLTRGYQSSVSPILHFGIGKNERVDTLEVVWPNGSKQVMANVAADQLLKVDIANGTTPPGKTKQREIRFRDITKASGIDFVHKEDGYDDFVFEPLLPHRYSRLGPALAVGDINGDGLDDFFVGNSAENPAEMYLQNAQGSFEKIDGPWIQDSEFEDTGALLFDADEDGDLDLYVVNGSNDKIKPETYFQDRLYMNTTNGFVKSAYTLPKITASGQEVIAGDYDADGDMDLFVGGRIVPGKYPYPAQSYVLRNDGGVDTALKYSDVTHELAPQLQKAGLVTAALWDDFDSDGKLDLIVSGEWMPIRFFRNKGDKFEEVTDNTGLAYNTGWWYSLQKADVDADGDTDYLAGNLGLNYKYRADPKAPFEVYANDFDENGSNDIVLSYEKKGTKLPLRGRECSSQQVPVIGMRFETFESFADASLSDIYGERMLQQSLHYEANGFASSWLENKGKGSFEMHILPSRAQFSSINAITELDYNGDNYPDFLVGGNLYSSEAETPRNDSSIGMVITKNADNGFSVLGQEKTGLVVEGEIRKMVPLNLGTENKQAYLFAINNDSLKLFSLDGY